MINKKSSHCQIALFPGLILDGTSGSDIIRFGNAIITNRSKLQYLQPDLLDNKKILKIERLIKFFNIKDTKGSLLDNFIVVFTDNIDMDNLENLNLDAEELIKFFAYSSDLKMLVPIDVFKMHNGCVLINNTPANLNSTIHYSLPIQQNIIPRLKLSTTAHKILTGINKGLETDIIKDKTEILVISIKLFNSGHLLEKRDPYGAVGLMVSAIETLIGNPQKNTKIEISNSIMTFYNQIIQDINVIEKNQNAEHASNIIKKTIDDIINLKSEVKYQFVKSIKEYCGQESEIEQWAKEIYDVRSGIYHGRIIRPKKLKYSGKRKQGDISPETRHISLFDIAEHVFMFILLCKMGELNLYANTNSQWKDNNRLSILNKIIANVFKIENLLSNKNYTYSNFSKNDLIYFEFVRNIRLLTRTDFVDFKIIKRLVKLIDNIGRDWYLNSWLPDYKKNITTTDLALSALGDDRKRNIEQILTALDDIEHNSTNGADIFLRLMKVAKKNSDILVEKINIFYDLEDFLNLCTNRILYITELSF